MKHTLIFILLTAITSLLLSQTGGTLPYNQDFSGAYFPPDNPSWTVRNIGGAGTWEGFEGSAISRSKVNNNNVTPNDWLISPSFAFEAGTVYAVKFDIKALNPIFPDDYITVYAMTGTGSGQCVDNNPNNIVLWSGYTPVDWTTQTATFTPIAETAGVRFISFRHHNCNGQSAVLLDNISFYEIVSDDLNAINLIGPAYYNPHRPYTLSIRNDGINNVSAGAFTLQMYSTTGGGAATPLGANITDTPAIASGELVTVTISGADWGFDVATATVYDIYATIIFAEDDTPANNTSNIWQITVLPSNMAVVDLMPPSPTYISHNYPANFYYPNSLSQVIFTAEDLGGLESFGKVTQLKLRIFDENIPSNRTVEFYLANAPSTFTSFEYGMGFLTYEHFVKVFDGPLPVGAGQNIVKDITLPLSTGAGMGDFIYEGENIVLMGFRTDTTNYGPSNGWHHNPGTAGINRAKYIYTDFSPAPFSPQFPNGSHPEVYGSSDIAFPKIVFFIEKGAVGTVSGVVTNATTSATIQGAKVSLAHIPDVFALTDENGAYTFADIPIERDIKASALGYVTQTIPFAEIGWNPTTHTANKNIALSPLPSGLSISGYVIRGDTDLYTSGITVRLSGYMTDEVITDNEGYFTFTGLYGNQAYTISIDYPRFYTYSQDIDLINSVDNISITLQEIIRPPLAVTAETYNSQSIVKWYNPYWGYKTFSHTRANIESAIGQDEAITFTVAHRYTSAQIEAMGGTGRDIYKVSFIPNHFTGATYTVKVWVTDNPAGTFPIGLEPVCEVLVTDVTTLEINEVALPRLISVPQGGLLYVGYEINTPGGFPAGIDYATHSYGFSDLLEAGGYWYTLQDAFGIQGSWCIYVSELEPEIDAEPAPVVLSATREVPPFTDAKRPLPLMMSAFNLGQPKGFPDYFLGHTPRNTTRAMEGEFEIYRTLSTQTIPDTPLHTTANAEVNMNRRNMQYIDTGWSGLSNGEIYRYAVKAKHTGDGYVDGYEVSEPLYTNNLLKAPAGDVTVNVYRQGTSVAGAMIYLHSDNMNVQNQSYMLSESDNGTHTFGVYTYVPYTVSVMMIGTPTYTDVYAFPSAQNEVNVSLLATDIVFSETFSRLTTPAGWRNLDVDDDNYTWKFGNTWMPGPGGLYVDMATYSETYYFDGLHEYFLKPDNWLISPQIALPDAEYISFDFLVATYSMQYPSERLFVYIAPAGTGEAGWQTFLVNRNVVTGNAGSPDSEVLQEGVVMLDDHIVLPEYTHDGFYKLGYDISSFAGQTVHIAFRHAFCEDQYRIKLANMAIYSASYTPITVSGVVVDENGAFISGAMAQISSTPPIYAMTSGSGAFSFPEIPGNATYTVIIKKQLFADKVIQITAGAVNYNMGNVVMVPGVSGDADVVVPSVTSLGVNYPNPFNPTTTISFDVGVFENVCIDIYNIKGQKVRGLVDGVYGVGSHTVVWNGEDDAGHSVGSGVYFYRMVSGEYVSTRKMLLLK